MVTGIDHIALSVSNLEHSIEFYKMVGNFEVIRIIDKNTGSKLGEVIGIPDAQARIAHLSDGRIMFELFEYSFPKPKYDEQRLSLTNLGFTHIGIRSNDTRKDYERLVAKGVKFITQPVEFRPGVWMCYFWGPDGETCELRQAD